MPNESHSRIEFLCRNAGVYTLNSSARTDQNFFDIGSEIPPKEFAKEIKIAGISDDPDGESGGNGNDGSADAIEQIEEDEGVPKFIIYAGAGLLLILILIIVIWQCYKCSTKRNAQGVR